MPQKGNEKQIKCQQAPQEISIEDHKQAAREVEEPPSHKRNSRLRQNPYSCSGRLWSLAENIRYLQFLLARKDVFSLSRDQKKKMKTNVMMSKRVRTRTPTQCHSHHQKMMQRYGTIEKVIEELQAIEKLYFVKEKRGRKNKTSESDARRLGNQREEMDEYMKGENCLAIKQQITDVLKEEENGQYRYFQ